MKGIVSYTSNVLASMSAASALASADSMQVPTSDMRMDVEDHSELTGVNTVVPAVDLDASSFFKDGVKRPGTDTSLHMSGNACPRVIISNFTDVEVPELGVKLPAHGLNVGRLHNQIWCKFLILEEAAKREELDADEQVHWDAYGKYFDYARYRAESAPLVKVFGTLMSYSEGRAVVRWLGGAEEVLHGNLAEKVSVLEGNSVRNFTAFARFVGYRLSCIEDVRPDCDADFANNDLSWMTEWRNG